MIKIDKSKCIGCGQCVKDCFPVDIELKDGKAVPKNDRCFECGHCVAVCPANAVTLLDYDMDEVLELNTLETEIDPEIYLNQLKARRSIRRFREMDLTYRQVKMILEAGRYSPTGGNRQNVAYHVIQKDIPFLREKVIDELKVLGDAMASSGRTISFYSDLWLDMHREYHEHGRDGIFFGAGTVIVLSSDDPVSAAIAAAHMETMIYSMGLGMLYSGFARRAIEGSKELQEKLRIKEGYQAQVVLVVGYPEVRYRRTAPRKAAEVFWN